MDEPCSALDPRATLQIEELMARAQAELHDRHRDPQHAAGGARVGHDRVPDDGRGPRRLRRRAGPTRSSIFTNPKNQLTEDYVSGRFG